MKKVKKVFHAFTLVEVLVVLSIFIILSAIGFNGFLAIRETFIAKENVELIIQDIRSARLKAMNMERGDESNWIYGFGIDFRNADWNYARKNGLTPVGDYRMFKWCAPVSEYKQSMDLAGTDYNLTGGVLPNYYTGINLGVEINGVSQCYGAIAPYMNGRIPFDCGNDGYTDSCQAGSTSLVSIVGEGLTLLDREEEQLQIYTTRDEEGNFDFIPSFLFFESLTGRTIIYDDDGIPLNYDPALNFTSDNFTPVDIILPRIRSEKFDMITIYPLSGEIIHHVYSSSDLNTDGSCPGGPGGLDCIRFEGNTYNRYGIEEEIKSYRD